MRSGLLRLHWLDVQRHIYGHSAHGFAMSMPGGWEAFLWQHAARKVALVCAREFPRVKALMDFVVTLNGWEVLVEIDPAIDSWLVPALVGAGFVPDCALPGHFIPTSDTFTDTLSVRLLEPGDLRRVTDTETLADFAYVQDQAYRATYDWPKGCASLFYTDPSSLISPDAVGAVLYENGMPVRTAALIHKRGIVAGVAGAAVPSVRGRHYGEQLMYVLLLAARQWWGAEYVHHITMPCARPIAARLGLETVTVYHRWRKA